MERTKSCNGATVHELALMVLVVHQLLCLFVAGSTISIS